jgi:hypothetical protein
MGPSMQEGWATSTKLEGSPDKIDTTSTSTTSGSRDATSFAWDPPPAANPT